MDDAVLKTISLLKTSFLIYLKEWELDRAYWILREIRAETESKFKEAEQKELEEDIKKLEDIRKKYLENKEKRGEFFIELEKFSIKLNRLMKKHGLYFREGINIRKAVHNR